MTRNKGIVFYVSSLLVRSVQVFLSRVNRKIFYFHLLVEYSDLKTTFNTSVLFYWESAQLIETSYPLPLPFIKYPANRNVLR